MECQESVIEDGIIAAEVVTEDMSVVNNETVAYEQTIPLEEVEPIASTSSSYPAPPRSILDEPQEMELEVTTSETYPPTERVSPMEQPELEQEAPTTSSYSPMEQITAMDKLVVGQKVVIQQSYPPLEPSIDGEDAQHEATPLQSYPPLEETLAESVSHNAESKVSQLESFDWSMVGSAPNNEHLTSEDLLKNSCWKLGQLAWARMSIYPFWPCMVSYDPSAMMTFQKVQSSNRNKSLMIHVHFFNDHGKHSWIPAHHMLPFNGIEEFRKRARLVTDAVRKKEPKFAAALTIKPSLFATWQKAVAEAMDVLYEIDLTSLEKFKPTVKETTAATTAKVAATKASGGGKKRKQKTQADGQPIKKLFKPNESAAAEVTPNTATSNPVLPNNLNLETPPVSPPNNDEDLRAATYQKQKRITKMINKLQPPDFEVYFERNFLAIQDQHSDATDEQIREYLSEVWDGMATEEKLKYRATYKIQKDS